MKLTYEEYRILWDGMSKDQQKRVKAKATYEQMTPWAVLNSWPSLRETLEYPDPKLQRLSQGWTIWAT